MEAAMRMVKPSKVEINGSNTAILFGAWVIVIAVIIIARGLFGHPAP